MGAVGRLLRGRRDPRGGWVPDAAIALGIAAAALAYRGVVERDGLLAGWDAARLTPAALAAVAVACAPLLLRSRWPVPVLALVAGALLAAGRLDPEHFAGLALLPAVHGVGSWAHPRVGAAAVGVYVALPVALEVLAGGTLPAALSGLLPFVALVGLSWGAGRAGRWRRDRAAREAADRDRRRREAAERGLAGERLRMARELHDVLAHSISVMVVQAAGAREVLDRDPDRAAVALDHIDATGRQSLVEVRRLLGLLPATPARADAEPGMGRVDDLVARVGEAGVDVRVAAEGDRVPLPPSTDLAAFRVVQESLTNVLKHAPGARADLRIRWSPDDLRIEVRDRGPAGRPVAGGAAGAGRGLQGMRERVRSVGGELEAGPVPGGGFRVAATLPVHDGVPAGPPGPAPGGGPAAPAVPPARRPRVELLADAALALLAVGLEAANLAPATLRQYEGLFDVDRLARPGPAAFAALVVIALPVLWRRRAPLAALAAVTAAGTALGIWLVLPLSWWASLFVLTAVAAHLRPWTSLAATAAVTAAALVTLAAGGYDQGGGVAVWYPAWFLIPWGVGLRQRAARLHEERRDAQVRERSLRVLADERSRVARELHGVLERSLDAMVDRAGAARALLPVDRAAAAAALAQVEGTGRAGMAEVRRLLAVLRDSEADRSPQPGLARLDELVEAARRAGTPVTVQTVAFRPPADPSVDVFAYRIVEEALANAGRHAPGSPVTVLLSGGDGRLTLEIVDRGPRRPGPEPVAGRGLAAMRERAELVGGTLRAGPTRRGFAVRAELPLEAP